MKKSSLFVFIILFVLALSACVQPADPAATTPVPDAPMLEPDRANLPSYETLLQIERQMSWEELNALAGNPQRTEKRLLAVSLSGASSWPTADFYVYDSKEGKSVYVYIDDSETVTWISTPEPPSNILVDGNFAMISDIPISQYMPILEPERSDLPSREALEQIEEDMTWADLLRLIGNPQREEIKNISFAPQLSSRPPEDAVCYIYECGDGSSLCVAFEMVHDQIEDVIKERVGYVEFIPAEN